MAPFSVLVRVSKIAAVTNNPQIPVAKHSRLFLMPPRSAGWGRGSVPSVIYLLPSAALQFFHMILSIPQAHGAILRVRHTLNRLEPMVRSCGPT